MTLSKFDGREVLNTTVAIRNAGDGLSKALGVDPVELHHGEDVYVVLHCTVDKVRFDPIKDAEDCLTRVHMLKAGDATMVDGDLVAEQLEAQARRIEEADGVHRLPFDDNEDEVNEE